MANRRRSGVVAAALCTSVALGAVVVAAQPTSARAASPTVIDKLVIGHSVAGRRIVAYHLGNPHSRIKAVVLGQMHGDEHAGVVVARSIIHGRPITGINLWVIPTMNPDGDARHRRKNRHGVDLNRNWPTRWAHLHGQYYSGRKPLSEPETRAMWRFLRSVRPTYLVSLHQPLDGVDTTDGGARNHAFRNRLARNLHLTKKPFRCWSVCHGSMTRWVTKHQSGAAITVEFPAHPKSKALRHRAPKGIIAAFRGKYR